MIPKKEDRAVIAQFEHSLAAGDYILYYQPKLDLQTGRPNGAEALVRFKSGPCSVLRPAHFLPKLKTAGLLPQLDIYVFKEACEFLKRHLSAWDVPQPISVNMSSQTAHIPGIIKIYARVLNNSGVPAELLELELTEEDSFGTQPQVQYIVQQIHSLGMRCSIDDFGSGYSSLNMLGLLDIDTVKMDRDFFKNIDFKDERRFEIIISIVQMAKRIGLKIVAEGVDTPDCVSVLKRLGCDYVQGYVYKKPMSEKSYITWLCSTP